MPQDLEDYRVHTIQVTVQVHKSIPASNDAKLIEALEAGITGLADGDVVVIETS